jgi:ribosomal protein L14
MFQKLTRVSVSDGTGIGWLQVFHLYRGSKRRYAKFGDFVKMSIRSINTFPVFIRGRRYRPLRVGYIVRGFATNICAWSRFFDGTRTRFFSNSVVLIKRKGLLKSKYTYTPLSRLIRKAKYRLLFSSLY